MARKKLTPAQRAASKQRQYVRSQYNLTIDALDYLNMMGANIKFKLVSKPTKASLNKIRRIYNQETKKLRQRNWSLPTKKELARAAREEQPYRKSRAKRAYESPTPTTEFHPETDYLQDLIEAVSNLESKMPSNATQRRKEYDNGKLQEAKNRLFDRLAFARQKTGDEVLADKLAQSEYVSRIESLSLKYSYEIVDAIDDELIPALEQAMWDALDEI
jgi:hypothetical protein